MDTLTIFRERLLIVFNDDDVVNDNKADNDTKVNDNDTDTKTINDDKHDDHNG